MIDRAEFGHRLRAARSAVGLTQAEAAEKLGVVRESYIQYELGRKGPSVLKLLEMVETLELDPRILIPEFFATPAKPKRK